MLYAINDKSIRKKASPKTNAKCPGCGGAVISKCGNINIWHWAHKAKETDCNYKPETDWHLGWKSHFPKERCEVRFNFHSEYKIADAVLKSGLVVEFQHSPISTEEIEYREFFYDNMMWVFDCREAFINKRIDLRIRKGKASTTYTTFRWKHAKKSISACEKPVYLDLGDNILQLKTMYKKSPVGGWGYLMPKESLIDKFKTQ